MHFVQHTEAITATSKLLSPVGYREFSYLISYGGFTQLNLVLREASNAGIILSKLSPQATKIPVTVINRSAVDCWRSASNRTDFTEFVVL